ncbi:isochorismatase family cysteine hydrolase [Chryseolinea soli]|uniref:Cysteine hydrolase n=1 Tax=Chryseolinea soli TaxID=2321403 RepID=A0A385T0J4_9BACT|nr:isochorismatase family cysteine hydrolase [Chryseolinea soli]AYB34588.1 cysteine hydrolase [Chryseolinea soli]
MTQAMKDVAPFLQSVSKKALLVIDVQENLLNPKSKLHMVPDEVLPMVNNVNRLIQLFLKTNHPIIYTVNEWTNPILNALTGNVCKKGSPGVGIDKQINVVSDRIYYKSKMNALSDKNLVAFLHQQNIEELYITGLFAEACVKSTARSAVRHGFTTVVVEDAVGSKSVEHKLRWIKYCQKKGATIMTSDQLTE